MVSSPSKAKVVEKEIKQTSMRFLSAFHLHPSGIRYVDQDADEEIILFLRRSLITTIPWVVVGVIAFFIPLALTALLPLLPFPVILPEFDSKYTLVGLLFYYLLVGGYLLSNFLLWFYNLSLVTNKKNGRY